MTTSINGLKSQLAAETRRAFEWQTRAELAERQLRDQARDLEAWKRRARAAEAETSSSERILRRVS